MSQESLSFSQRVREARLVVASKAARAELIYRDQAVVLELCDISRRGLSLPAVETIPLMEPLEIRGSGRLAGMRAKAAVVWRDFGRMGLVIKGFLDKQSERLWLSAVHAAYDAHLLSLLERWTIPANERDEFYALIGTGELLQEERQRNQFVHVMSLAVHDLLNPLGAAYSTIQLLTSGMMTSEQFMAGGLAKVVERNCARVLEEIEELLSLAAASESSPRLQFSRCSLPALFQEIGEAHLARAMSKGIELAWDAPKGLALVADRGKILRLLGNLVSNALKFTKEGGRVTISAREAGESVVLTVRDTGLGMSAADAERLFEASPTEGPAPTGGESTHGLGLLAAKAIVHAHRGSIHVESEVGKGSVFTVRLPRRTV